MDMLFKPKTAFSLALAVLTVASSVSMLSGSADAANLTNVRIKQGGVKTEIVLDLNGPAEDVVLTQDDPNTVALQFNGGIDSQIKNCSQAFPGHKNLKSMYCEVRGGKVQLFVKRKVPSPTRVFPLSNPDRLVLSIQENYNHEQSQQVVPGVTHKQIVKTYATGPMNINILEIDTSNPDITIEPVLATTRLHGKAKVADMVNRSGALAGVNAAFFKPDSGTNLGTMIMNRELIAGPLYNRVALGMTTDKQFKMARLSLGGKVVDAAGQSLPLHNVNQPRLSKSEFILYTPRWGQMSPNTPPEGVQIQIVNNQITEVSDMPLSIPGNGYVLVGPRMGLAAMAQPGDSLSPQVYTIPDWSDVQYAISGGPYLVRNGQVYVDLKEQSFRDGSFTKPAPRTAVGIKADKKMLMVTVDGRQADTSVGMTLTEMATLMRELGAVEAMNFDGGSSTQMVVNGRVVNSSKVSGGLAVSSSLVVRHNAPYAPRDVIGSGYNFQQYKND